MTDDSTPARPDRGGYWTSIWADPEIAPQILQQGRIFRLTQRNFERTLDREFGPLTGRTVLDFGCGDGRLLSRLECGERLLFEPSPVYAPDLATIVTGGAVRHRARRIAELDDVAAGSVDLVVLHGVAHYMTRVDLAEMLQKLRPRLTHAGLGVVIADLPHANRFADALGGLFAHPSAAIEVARQVFLLSGSRYSWDRLHKHTLIELVQLAQETGYRLRELDARSFNRARRTVLLELGA